MSDKIPYEKTASAVFFLLSFGKGQSTRALARWPFLDKNLGYMYREISGIPGIYSSLNIGFSFVSSVAKNGASLALKHWNSEE